MLLVKFRDIQRRAAKSALSWVPLKSLDDESAGVYTREDRRREHEVAFIQGYRSAVRDSKRKAKR